MNSEFEKLGPDIARSAKGFTVAFRPQWGVEYSDTEGKKIRVDSEMLVKPFRHGLYAKSKDLRSMTSPEADEILSNIQRAMQFLGRATEVIGD